MSERNDPINENSIRIKIPGPNNKQNALEQTFLVVGVAIGHSLKKETAIEGTITNLNRHASAEAKKYTGKHAIWCHTSKPHLGTHPMEPPRPLASGHPYLWALLFEKVEIGVYNLKVSIKDIADTDAIQSIDNVIVGRVPSAERGPPAIIYPAPNQNITAEENDFNSYGTDNQAPSSATLGSQTGSITWSPLYSHWLATFGQITGTGELVLSVTDSTGTTSEYVVVNS